ncbi:MAG: hypothetical protein LBJ96_04065 [Holosporaceae bacterium]|nr:hypothetical protein [Holosporaceae bacterium]
MNNIFKIGFLVGVLFCCFSSDARIGVGDFKSSEGAGVYVNRSEENNGIPPCYLLFWGSVMRHASCVIQVF